MTDHGKNVGGAGGLATQTETEARLWRAPAS